jgi:hypothetical protein
VGQIINVLVDVNTMVKQLPRQLDDDHAFNVHIKKHLLHSSIAYKGLVKKSTVKAWLTYLLQTPLYKVYNITVDEEFMRVSVEDKNKNSDYDDIDGDCESDDAAMDILEPDSQSCPSALRLFHTVAEVENYNALAISGDDVISHTALDLYAGYENVEQIGRAHV